MQMLCFRTLTRNVRERRGEKPAINIPSTLININRPINLLMNIDRMEGRMEGERSWEGWRGLEGEESWEGWGGWEK